MFEKGSRRSGALEQSANNCMCQQVSKHSTWGWIADFKKKKGTRGELNALDTMQWVKRMTHLQQWLQFFIESYLNNLASSTGPSTKASVEGLSGRSLGKSSYSLFVCKHSIARKIVVISCTVIPGKISNDQGVSRSSCQIRTLWRGGVLDGQHQLICQHCGDSLVLCWLSLGSLDRDVAYPEPPFALYILMHAPSPVQIMLLISLTCVTVILYWNCRLGRATSWSLNRIPIPQLYPSWIFTHCSDPLFLVLLVWVIFFSTGILYILSRNPPNVLSFHGMSILDLMMLNPQFQVFSVLWSILGDPAAPYGL